MGESNVRQDEGWKALEEHCREEGEVFNEVGKLRCCKGQLTRPAIDETSVVVTSSNECRAMHAMDLRDDIELSEDCDDSGRWRCT